MAEDPTAWGTELRLVCYSVGMTKVAKLKLYHYPATRSARVKWLLHELVDDAFEVQVVALYEGEQYGQEYLQKNPNHNVPTLEVTTAEGETLRMIESGAMIALLADAYPDKGLAPPPGTLSPARIDYLQMLHFAVTSMDMMLWQVRVHEHLLPPSQRDPRTSARYRHKFDTEVQPQLLTRLRKTSYICGEAFSAADCPIVHGVLWARLYGMAQDPGFDPYISRVSSRPAFLKAFADLGQFNPEVPDSAPVATLFTG